MGLTISRREEVVTAALNHWPPRGQSLIRGGGGIHLLNPVVDSFDTVFLGGSVIFRGRVPVVAAKTGVGIRVRIRP